MAMGREPVHQRAAHLAVQDPIDRDRGGLGVLRLDRSQPGRGCADDGQRVFVDLVRFLGGVQLVDQDQRVGLLGIEGAQPVQALLIERHGRLCLLKTSSKISAYRGSASLPSRPCAPAGRGRQSLAMRL